MYKQGFLFDQAQGKCKQIKRYKNFFPLRECLYHHGKILQPCSQLKGHWKTSMLINHKKHVPKMLFGAIWRNITREGKRYMCDKWWVSIFQWRTYCKVWQHSTWHKRPISIKTLAMNSGAELNCDSVNLFDKLENIYILLYALSIRLYFVVPLRIFFVGRGRLVG